MTLVSIIIPTFNKSPLVCDVIDKLSQQTFKDFEVLVVDDGSSDNTIRTLKHLRRQSHWPKVKVFQTGLTEEFGMCQAINLGLSQARGNIALLVNDDVYLHSDCIAQHLKVHDETGGGQAVLGPRFHDKKVGKFVPWRSATWRKHVSAYTTEKQYKGYHIYRQRHMVSSNLSAPTHLLCKIGGYNEFFTQYTGAIDRDLYYRLEQVDIKVLYTWWAQAYSVNYSHPLYKKTKWMRDSKFREGLNVSDWKRKQMRYSERLELLAREHKPKSISCKV